MTTSEKEKPPQILTVVSMAMGQSLDARVSGEAVSLLASVDGVETHFLIPKADWTRIVTNVDWWRRRDTIPPTERDEREDDKDVDVEHAT